MDVISLLYSPANWQYISSTWEFPVSLIRTLSSHIVHRLPDFPVVFLFHFTLLYMWVLKKILVKYSWFTRLCSSPLFYKVIQLHIYTSPFFFRFYFHVGYQRILSRVLYSRCLWVFNPPRIYFLLRSSVALFFCSSRRQLAISAPFIRWCFLWLWNKGLALS